MTDNLFSYYLVPAAIAYIMFGIGLNLDFSEFKKTFKKPKALIVGLIAQMLILPSLAFLLNLFLPINPIYKVGLVLIAACPGGTTSNIVTLFLKGRLALSVTLTAFNSFLILFTIPSVIHLALYIYEGLDQEIQMPVVETMVNMFLTVVFPTIIGMTIRYNFKSFVLKVEKLVNWSMTLFLLLVFLGIFIFENSISENLSEYRFLFIPAFLLNVISMFAGYILARGFGINNHGRFTIAIQVGLQNSALAIYVATKLLGQMELAIVAIIYSSFTLFTTAFWAYLMKKYM